MTETQLRTKMVDTAKKYIGVKQGTEKHKHIVDLFNKIRPDGWAMTLSAPWCACFSSGIAIEVLGVEQAKKFFPLSANCVTIIEKAKKLGIWVESDTYKPKKGDWILYDWDDSGVGDNHGSPDHVGIVASVSGNTIKVIEGNKGTTSQVGERVITKGGRYIRGYACPKYAKMAAPAKKATSTAKKTEAKPTAKKTVIYKVKKGDTLTAIAKKHGTTVEKIAKDNHIKDVNLIFRGQRLKIVK